MAETPIEPNGQIDFVYTVAGFTHRSQMRCTISNPEAVANFNLVTPDGDLLWTDAVDDAMPLFRPFYTASANFVQADLQLYDSGAYVLLDSYSLGLAGTASGSNFNTGQSSWTLKDYQNKTVKFVQLECIAAPPQRVAFASLSGISQSLVNSMLDNSPGNIGAWFRGRSGAQMHRFITVTVSINKRLQRKRGLA